MNSLICFIGGFVVAVVFCSFIFFKFMSDLDDNFTNLLSYIDKRIDSLKDR